MNSPLSGIRVLDLSRVLAGPWASQTLADLGAEVIKIERPNSGDDTRHWGPPFACDEHGEATSESAYFLSANRGKKSVAIDIAQAQGAELIRQLVPHCDVVLENFKVGGLKKYGLDYPALSAINPKLVYCSITGFGQTGPYKHRPGYDFLLQGMGGMMSVTGKADDQVGGSPEKAGIAVADLFTGLYSTIAILSAIRQRDLTGKGEYIDMALLDVQVAVMANQASNYLVSGISPTRLGNAHQNIVPYQTFASADGHLILAVGNDSQFASFCRTIGRAELYQDPRFETNPNRVKHREELIPLISEALLSKTTAEWIAELEAANVPCGPINTLQQVFENEQVQARGLQVSAPHPLAGNVPLLRTPIRMASDTLETPTAPPILGQHTQQVLSDLLGLDEASYAALKQCGVIA